MKITKAIREALRRELAAKGYAPPDIAIVMMARYRVRPRLALRWARGMTLDGVADEWNQLDGSGRAPMSARRVSDYERWPNGGKRPTAYVLLMLAKIYGVSVPRLLDERDYAALGEKQLFEVVELVHAASGATPEQAQKQAQAVADAAASGETRPCTAREAKEAGTERRHVLQIGGLAVADHLVDLLDNEPDRMHAALDAGTVSEERLAYFEQVADRFGVEILKVPPPTLLHDAVSHFRSVRRLVSDPQRTAAQVRLSRVGAKLGIVVGEIMFNEGQFDLAGEWLRVSEHAALAAGDRYLADHVLVSQAIHLTYMGDPVGVLALVDPRLAQRARPTPAIAWLWGLKARAHAMLGERAAFQRAMSQARKVLDGSPPELIVPGTFSLRPEQVEFYEATGYVRLRDAGHALQAADRALALYDPTEVEDPALVRLDKASALAQDGEVPEACRVATRAVDDPRTYHSVQVMVRAREFDALLGKDRAPVVRDWREVLAAVRWPKPAGPLALPRGEAAKGE